MKNIISKLLIIGIVSISIVNIGCKKDEVEQNSFTFLDDTYKINYCGILKKGITDHTPLNTYEYEVAFSSSKITYDETFNELTSSGSIFSVTIYSSNEDYFLTGDYTYDGFHSNDDYTLFDNYFSFGIMIDYFNSGILEYKRVGNTYKFKFDFYYVYNLEGQVMSYQLKGFYNGVATIITPPSK